MPKLTHYYPNANSRIADARSSARSTVRVDILQYNFLVV